MSKVLVVLVVLALWSLSPAVSATGAGQETSSWLYGDIHHDQNGVRLKAGLLEGQMEILDVQVEYNVLSAEWYANFQPSHLKANVGGNLVLAEAHVRFSERARCSISIKASANAGVGLGYASWSIEAGVTVECQFETAAGLVISTKLQPILRSWSGHINIWDTVLKAKFDSLGVGFEWYQKGLKIPVSIFGQEIILQVGRDGISMLFNNQILRFQKT